MSSPDDPFPDESYEALSRLINQPISDPPFVRAIELVARDESVFGGDAAAEYARIAIAVDLYELAHEPRDVIRRRIAEAWIGETAGRPATEEQIDAWISEIELWATGRTFETLDQKNFDAIWRSWVTAPWLLEIATRAKRGDEPPAKPPRSPGRPQNWLTGDVYQRLANEYPVQMGYGSRQTAKWLSEKFGIPVSPTTIENRRKALKGAREK